MCSARKHPETCSPFSDTLEDGLLLPAQNSRQSVDSDRIVVEELPAKLR